MSCNGFHIFLGAAVVILRIRVQNPPPPNHRCGDLCFLIYYSKNTVTSDPPSPTVHLNTTNCTRESPSKSDFNWNYSPSNNKRPWESSLHLPCHPPSLDSPSLASAKSPLPYTIFPPKSFQNSWSVVAKILFAVIFLSRCSPHFHALLETWVLPDCSLSLEVLSGADGFPSHFP